MRTAKTSELIGDALGWAVKMAEGEGGVHHAAGADHSINWEKAGAIIERERIELRYIGGEGWEATCHGERYISVERGATPLIAAMRCYVAHNLDEEIEIPEELTGGTEMKQKYEVHERVVNVYKVEAESFDEALELAEKMSAPTYSTNDGFDYVINTDTQEDLLL